MIVEIDHRSPIPPYEQLRAGIASEIASGEMGTGHRLPSVRQLARDLGLAPNTVVRAYRELSGDGLVVIEGRRGAFVMGPTASPAGAEIRRSARAFAEQAMRRGLDRAAALAEVARALDESYLDPRLPM